MSTDNSMSRYDIANYVVSHLQDPMSRINGVGNFNVFGTQYAMRIWLDTDKLNSFALTPVDVSNAIQNQNVQVAGGQLGGTPAPTTQRLTATITEATLLRTPAGVRQHPAQGQRRRVAGAHARRRARRARRRERTSSTRATTGSRRRASASSSRPARMRWPRRRRCAPRSTSCKPYFPHGLQVVYPYDTTPFVKISITEVVKTLFEGIVLVFLVMYLFLQNLRATLIPTIAVPVVLLGTFGVMAAFGFTINTLSMFGLVLAIGLLVDDAIVVVENVERVMSEEGLSPREATRKAMGQITGALVGVAVVLSAVFVPMAFSGGSVGAIYRQFSLTIVSAMLLSVFVALSLTPALVRDDAEARSTKAARRRKEDSSAAFNRGFEHGRDKYIGGVRHVMRSLRTLAADLWRAHRRRRVAVRAPADRVPARRGSGHRVRPGADPAGRDARAHARRARGRIELPAAGRGVPPSTPRSRSTASISRAADRTRACCSCTSGTGRCESTPISRRRRSWRAPRSTSRRTRMRSSFRSIRRRSPRSERPRASTSSSRIAADSATTS